MKLKIDRREEKQGMIFKKMVYFLDYTVEITPEENALIKKHDWNDIPMIEYQPHNDGVVHVDKLFMILRAGNIRAFQDVTARMAYEEDLDRKSVV